MENYFLFFVTVFFNEDFDRLHPNYSNNGKARTVPEVGRAPWIPTRRFNFVISGKETGPCVERQMEP